MRVAILGTGLIGASIGLAARRAGHDVSGWDADAEAHDRLLAITSHLPHALANLLLNQAGTTSAEGYRAIAAAGPSFRDLTRVAGANPRIWVDIFLDNAEPLQDALAEHRRRVEQLERALAAGDAGFLARWIGEPVEHRRELLQ